jgi:hypothetical protein
MSCGPRGLAPLLCAKRIDEEVSVVRQILSNGFVAIIPILVWNGIFTSKLPAAFSPTSFDRNVPFYIIAGENTFRFTVFLMPLFLRLRISTPIGKTGTALFLFGVLLYFLSWLVLIYAPASRWSASILGFCAPACTPLIWLVGISLMADSYYFDAAYSKWHFIVPSLGFLLFHILHTIHAYKGIQQIS